MKKLKSQNNNRARTYLSYTQLKIWEKSPDLYRQIYLEGKEMPKNYYMELGSRLADTLESDEADDYITEHLRIFLPSYPRREWKLTANFYGIPLLAKLDGWNLPKKEIGEFKTGKKWTQVMADKSDQLTFYALVAATRYGVMPSLRLHWIRTKEEDGELILTDEITTFITKRTTQDFLKLYPRLKSAWEGIGKLCDEYAKTQRHS